MQTYSIKDYISFRVINMLNFPVHCNAHNKLVFLTTLLRYMQNVLRIEYNSKTKTRVV